MKRFRLATMAAVFGLCAPASADVKETFEDDKPGAAPAAWKVTGGDGTDASAKVVEAGGAKFLALRDAKADQHNLFLERELPKDQQTRAVNFDIRFNKAPDTYLRLRLITPPGTEPIALLFYTSAFNTSNPILLTARGNDTSVSISENFPLGTWQTVRVEYETTSSGLPRGTYKVTWNGKTTAADFLDQGPNSNVAPTLLHIDTVGKEPANLDVDIDNLVFEAIAPATQPAP